MVKGAGALERTVADLERKAEDLALQLEDAAAGRSDIASVLITDGDGADFLASAKFEDDGADALVITTGIFTNHSFSGGLTADDDAAITKLYKDYETVAIHHIDGYGLRLINEAYEAAIARAEGIVV